MSENYILAFLRQEEILRISKKYDSCYNFSYCPYGKRYIRKLVRVYPRGKQRRMWIKMYNQNNLAYKYLLYEKNEN